MKEKSFYEVIGQIYRGEVSRANAYRNLVDSPTNWSVGVTTFIISATFGFESTPKYLPLLGIPVLLFFLRKEMHRSRKYHSALTRAMSLQELMLSSLKNKNLGVNDIKHALNYDKLDVSALSTIENRFFHSYFILLLLLVFSFFLA